MYMYDMHTFTEYVHVYWGVHVYINGMKVLVHNLILQLHRIHNADGVRGGVQCAYIVNDSSSNVL